MKVKYNTFIIILIILMFIADGANRVLIYLDAPFQRVSILVRLCAQMFFLLLLLRKRQGIKVWALMFFFYAVFLLGSIAAVGLYEAYDWVENFAMVNKALFFFVCWETFRQYFQTEGARRKLFKVFEILVGVEVLSVLIGYVFDLEVFASYQGFRRFGFKGLIPAQNEVSGFFVIAFFYFLWKVIDSRQGGVKLIVILIAALLTGTKVTLLLPIALSLYIIRWLVNLRVSKVTLSIIAIVLALVVFAILQMDYILARIAPTISYYSYTLGEGYSYFDLFASGRHFRVETFVSEFLSQFGFFNYLFGGHDLTALSVESDPVNVFARFGLLGSIVFYGLYVKVLLHHERTIGFTHLLFVFTWLGVSAVAGHLVFSAINGVYLAIFLLAFHLQEVCATKRELGFSQRELSDHRGVVQA